MTLDLTSAWWCLVLLGLAAGVLSGTLGVGSGIIVVPALVLLFGFSQKSAQGMALVVMVPMAAIGAYRYWRNPEIDVNLWVAGILIVGAIVGTLIGTEVAARLPGEALRKIFAVFILVVAIHMLISPSSPARPSPETSPAAPPAAPAEKESVPYDTGPTESK